MQFAKLLLPPQLSPPHAPNALTSSPTKQRDNRPEHLFDGPYHLRTHSSAALPPQLPLLNAQNHRTAPPSTPNAPNNPEQPKMRKMSGPNQEVRAHPGGKLRKGSENIVMAVEWEGGQGLGNSGELPRRGRDGRGKERKGSCNIEVGMFLKRIGRMEAEEEGRQKRETMLLKKKRSWDENKNFQLAVPLQQSEEQQCSPHPPPPAAHHPPMDIPRIANIRKHSQNDVHLKKAPSFLSSPKNHRNSLDCPERGRKGLGIGNFLIVKELGKGAFGRVVLGVERTSGAVWAIKILAKREVREGNMVEQLTRELKIQLFVNHPHVVKVHGYFDDLLHFYIVMECALDGHLSETLQRASAPLSEAAAAPLLHQLCVALAALHAEQIIHRDLKPENVMLHEGVVKICDFGWSVRRDAGLRTTFCGTPIYLSPEVLVGEDYDEGIDIWSVGMILYEMLHKANPFGITNKQTLTNILNEPVRFDPTNVPISDCARQFIELCLKKQAAERPNIRELLAHEFLARFNTEEAKR